MTQETIARWSSRKWLTMIGAVGLFTALLLAGKLTEQYYAWLVMPTIASYLASNVSASIWGRK